jgi:hypothetical protein
LRETSGPGFSPPESEEPGDRPWPAARPPLLHQEGETVRRGVADRRRIDDKVTLKNPGGLAAAGDLVLTVNKDGSLTGPEGVVLAKKKS